MFWYLFNESKACNASVAASVVFFAKENQFVDSKGSREAQRGQSTCPYFVLRNAGGHFEVKCLAAFLPGRSPCRPPSVCHRNRAPTWQRDVENYLFQTIAHWPLLISELSKSISDTGEWPTTIFVDIINRLLVMSWTSSYKHELFECLAFDETYWF